MPEGRSCAITPRKYPSRGDHPDSRDLLPGPARAEVGSSARSGLSSWLTPGVGRRASRRAPDTARPPTLAGAGLDASSNCRTSRGSAGPSASVQIGLPRRPTDHQQPLARDQRDVHGNMVSPGHPESRPDSPPARAPRVGCTLGQYGSAARERHPTAARGCRSRRRSSPARNREGPVRLPCPIPRLSREHRTRRERQRAGGLGRPRPAITGRRNGTATPARWWRVR